MEVLLFTEDSDSEFGSILAQGWVGGFGSFEREQKHNLHTVAFSSFV